MVLEWLSRYFNLSGPFFQQQPAKLGFSAVRITMLGQAICLDTLAKLKKMSSVHLEVNLRDGQGPLDPIH